MFGWRLPSRFGAAEPGAAVEAAAAAVPVVAGGGFFAPSPPQPTTIPRASTAAAIGRMIDRS
jgi:hypothetical protein